ncbi:MAG: hypothetical protein OXF54_12980 [Caldilineaceae bacterium]|nr:hypothetical protein [Caldilineaceae bacterium]
MSRLSFEVCWNFFYPRRDAKRREEHLLGGLYTYVAKPPSFLVIGKAFTVQEDKTEDTLLDAASEAKTKSDDLAVIDAFHIFQVGQVGPGIKFDKAVVATKRTLLFCQVEFRPHDAELILS